MERARATRCGHIGVRAGALEPPGNRIRPDSNRLLNVFDHGLRSRNYVNIVTCGEQPQLQWLTMDEAREHCSCGASIWKFATNDGGGEPDVVLASAGDAPFDMVVLNEMSRYQLALDGLAQVPRLRTQAAKAVDFFNAKLYEHHAYIREHLEDMPDITNWRWTDEFGEANAPPPLAKGHPRANLFTDS